MSRNGFAVWLRIQYLEGAQLRSRTELDALQRGLNIVDWSSKLPRGHLLLSRLELDATTWVGITNQVSNEVSRISTNGKDTTDLKNVLPVFMIVPEGKWKRRKGMMNQTASDWGAWHNSARTPLCILDRNYRNSAYRTKTDYLLRKLCKDPLCRKLSSIFRTKGSDYFYNRNWFHIRVTILMERYRKYFQD